MKSSQHILQVIQKNDVLISMNLRESYPHIPIHLGSKEFLCFYNQGYHFKYKALSSGLTSAPKVFTKIMVAKFQQKRIYVYPYLDAIFIIAKDKVMSSKL